MGSKALSGMVKQVFGSEDLKKQFISNPGSVMARFNLSKQEKEVVLGAHAKLSAGSSEDVMKIDPLAMWP